MRTLATAIQAESDANDECGESVQQCPIVLKVEQAPGRWDWIATAKWGASTCYLDGNGALTWE
jgi:hypothetical protein